MAQDAHLAIERAYREEWTTLLATLAGQVGGDVGLAEEAVADAFAAAAAEWPATGVPERPGGWLTTVARRRAIDALRRGRTRTANQAALEHLEALVRDENDTPTADEHGHDRSGVTDDRLRLLFTCCHPALALEARVALTLRAVGGLEVPEIARAFLTTETTMYQRLVRAKRKIKAAGIPYRVPPDDELPERLDGVLHVLHLVYTEGHVATTGDSLVRADLCVEAIRLTRLVVELLPAEAEAHGLLSLLLLTDARRPARTDADGRRSASRTRTGPAGTAPRSPKAPPCSTTPSDSAGPVRSRCRRRSRRSTPRRRPGTPPTGRRSPPSTASSTGSPRRRSSR